MQTFRNLLIFSIIVLVPGQLFASNEYSLTTNPKSSLSSVLSKKKPKKKEFPFRQIASFYPVKALANYMMGGYERQVGAKHVLKIAAGYTYFEEQTLNTSFNGNELRDFSGTRFDIMVKYFMGKDASIFNGLYIAPYFSFKNSNFKYNLHERFSSFDEIWEEASATSYTTGFLLGFQVPLSNSFTADLYVGNALIKSSGNYVEASHFLDSYRNSIGLISGFSVGFGF